jgi:hypothetical protein
MSQRRWLAIEASFSARLLGPLGSAEETCWRLRISATAESSGEAPTLASMTQDPLFEIGSVMERLRPVMRSTHPRTSTDFAAALPEFAALQRYAGNDGADRLLRDIESALDDLPQDPKLKKAQHREWGRLILGLDQPTESLTSRRRDLAEGNGSARKNRDRFVVGAVLHSLELQATDAPPSSSLYDSGFEVLMIATELRARARDPLTVRHEVNIRVRATRAGQRIVPICYGATEPFASIVAQSSNRQKLGVAYMGSSALITGNPDFPTHLFWLSGPPTPDSEILIRVVFDEIHRDVWTAVRSRLQLITSGKPSVVMRAMPAKAFERVIGYRLPPNSADAKVRLDRAPRSSKTSLEYRPRRAKELTAFELRCLASAKHLDRQRESMKR